MSKRRRASSAASRGQDDDYLEESTPEPSPAPSNTRKRKRLDPSELCQQLYDSVRNHKKEDGTPLCDAFIRAPKRRQEPGYYEVVSNPIDLLRVQQKLKTDSYEDVEELTSDFELLVNNARAFYSADSDEHKDANALWELFQTQKARILESEEKCKTVLRVGRQPRRSAVDTDDASETSTTPEEDYSQYEDLFTAVMTATDVESNNRPLHTVFQILPSKKRYPEYYEVIESPIDLRMIATKIQNNSYQSLSDMEKDLLTMTRNACLFNEPGSQIYKDAKALKKVISSKKIEVEHNKPTPTTTGKTSERIRNKRIRGTQSLSAITAALTEEDLDSDEEEDASGHTDGGDTPQWQIFDMLRNAVNTSGVPLTEAFWKLPSRKYYPDYYKQIKTPISLNQIHARLRRGEYITVSKMCTDLNLLFENAKKYNVHTSKIYKDASKLQKMVLAKRQELNEMEESESDCDSTDSRSLASVKRRSIKVRTPVAHTTVPTPIIPTTPLSGKRYRENPLLKKKLIALQKCLVEYTGDDGRQPMMVFMEKPSKKLYPDYYQIIQQPIDMQTIDNNIKCEKYATVDDMVGDCRMMFNNCRKYNEEGSVIYEDANTLERVLNEKLKELSQPERNEKRTPNKSLIFKEVFLKSGRPRAKPLNPLETKLKTLYEAIRDYREPKANRQLALVFMKLPSKNDYPDYYDIIKQPIDMERIAQRLKIAAYESVDELASEFLLMFENACKYNEPDSQIYKDALELQRICLQTKHSLSEEPQSVPDVIQAVQGILLSLFTSTYTYQDEEGRCYSDSLTELPEYDEIDGQKVRGVSLDLVKRRLDRGLYKRLDSFQEDVFSCFERARKLSRTDSQAFEDSVEMQTYFIKQRDELCKNGAVLSSPALQYTLAHLTSTVESVRGENSSESLGGAETDDSETVAPVAASKGESMTCNQQVYRVGEFVYMEPEEKGVDPRIIYIERLWTNAEQQQMLYGNCFFRPHETFHVATRRFLEQEVFKSDLHIAVPLSQLQGKCYVMSVKEYFKNKPEGFADKDVYVCECRYSTKLRAFKKIKIWQFQIDTAATVPRETPLEPRRVMSIFKERVEKHKGELAELQLQEKLVDKEKPNVIAVNVVGEEGNTYYEQYNTICSGVVKTGDFVYVAGDGGRQLIAQIQAIWETKDGKCYFRGPWLVPPPEVPHAGSRLFYPQEVFLSTLHDCSPLVGIVGRCAVMELKDYVTSRLTEIPESDVYVVESVYDEVKRQIRKLTIPGLRKFIHSTAVTPDEVYYFPKTICPPKIGASEIAALHADVIKAQPCGNMMDMSVSAIPGRIGDAELMQDDSLDAPASVTSGDPPTPCATPIPMQPTPVSTKKGKSGKKLVTGYILYSSEVRKSIVSANPESTFGEISRIVGNEWRSLPTQEKQAWEEKADRCNKETAARLAAENENCPSPGQPQIEIVRSNVFECCWDKCDFQFEDLSDCSEHCLADGTGHIPLHFSNIPQGEAEFHCQWRGCIRVKKQAPPFPHLQRLSRHVREVHINKGNGRFIAAHDRSKNYVPSRRVAVAHQQMVVTPNILPVFTTANKPSPPVPMTATVVQKQLEPIFVSVPPRPQRVLHSDAYIKYIEGLQAESRSINNWEKSLKATQQTVPPPDESRLPAHWLANGQGAHGSVINALWALRDHMFRDALSIHRQL